MSKGFGYVKFGDEDQAKKAMDDLNRTRLQGKELKIDYAIDRVKRN